MRLAGAGGASDNWGVAVGCAPNVAFAIDVEQTLHAHSFLDTHRGQEPDRPGVLPLRQKTVRIPGSPPAVATPLIPGYADLVDHVHSRMGWLPGSFVGVRWAIKWPPLGAVPAMRFQLPERPQ